jgi:homoserine O-acetyltransferase
VILAERNALASPTLSPGGEAMRTAAAVSADVLDARRGTIDAVLATRHAGTRKLRIAYELAGPAGAPVVFVAGGISAHRHVAANALDRDAGWAEGLLDAGRALDPANLRILAFDYVGADGSIDAPIDTADQADALALLLDALGIDALEAFVGYSYGALVGLQLAARHPQRLRKLVAVSGVHRAHPYAAAWRALQRKAVALGQLQCADEQGLSLARQFAMLSYRTPEEFGERFDAAPRSSTAACAWPPRITWTPPARSTSRARRHRLPAPVRIDRPAPRGSREVHVPTTVVAVEGDRLVPLSDSVALVEGLGLNGRLRVLRSPYGHDAFLKETDRIDAHPGRRTAGPQARHPPSTTSTIRLEYPYEPGPDCH